MQTSPPDMPHSPPQPVTVVPVSGESPKRAQRVAAQLMLPCRDRAGSADLLLVVGEAEAWLELEGVKVNVQFDSAAMRHRRKGGHNELLGRAGGVKADRKPRIFDATGGMGRDAFVLADLGCAVTLCERVPVLLWLLQEALSLASVSRYEPVRDAAARMQIRAGDSQRQAVAAGSVIYLDPMFPERKKAAAVKKEALMLQSLTDVQDVGDALWAWAWAQPVERIVVKRPLRAPTLGDQKPSHSLSGKAVRFDVFVRQIEQGSTR